MIRGKRIIVGSFSNMHVNQHLVGLGSGPLGRSRPNKGYDMINADRCRKYLHQRHILMLKVVLEPIPQYYLERDNLVATCNQNKK